ncbi:unnamed protein product [Natator depressus]
MTQYSGRIKTGENCQPRPATWDGGRDLDAGAASEPIAGSQLLRTVQYGPKHDRERPARCPSSSARCHHVGNGCGAAGWGVCSVANSHDFVMSLMIIIVFLQAQLLESSGSVMISAFILKEKVKETLQSKGCSERAQQGMA